jgi:MFS family permease
MIRRRANGRMLVAALALSVSIPAGYLALEQPAGALISFMCFQGVASMMMYTYYATVYSTIQDIVEPSLRGTAMAIYFFAMYILGAALGPIGTGWVSDLLARRAAAAANLALSSTSAIPEQFRAIGLHQAMYMVPILGVLLVLVLLAGSVTVRKDMQRLQDWMTGASQ